MNIYFYFLCNKSADVHFYFFYACSFMWALEDFVVEVQLDRLKQNQKESIRRTLFLDTQQAGLVKTFSLANGERLCHETKVYLRVSHTSCVYTIML